MSIDLTYDENRPLFVPNGERFSMNQSQEALKLVYSSGKPVLIYIHGRAKGVGEPVKSMNQNIYSDLAAYGVEVLGFTWDADDGGFDESRPIESADEFSMLLDALAEFMAAPENSGAAKPSLIAHSMGNLIIAELAEEDDLGMERGKLIQNLVMSAPAVKVRRHHRWLRKIKVAEKVYVMVNPNDTVLMFAGFVVPAEYARTRSAWPWGFFGHRFLH